MNQTDEIVTEDFAKHFGDLCGLVLAAEAFAKLSLYHAEGRLHV
jgi:hypothetical protein